MAQPNSGQQQKTTKNNKNQKQQKQQKTKNGNVCVTTKKTFFLLFFINLFSIFEK